MDPNKAAKDISSGYYNLIRSKFGLLDSEEEILFEKREEICNKCINNKLGICTLCGCVIKAKTKSIYSECPDELW